MRQAMELWEEIDADYAQRFGRGGAPILDPYRCEDADFVVVAMGSIANQFHVVVDRLREEEGLKVGVLALQIYRPFPTAKIAEALQSAKGVMVYEKGLSYGNQGALYADLKSALYPYPNRPQLHNFIVGLGGRDIPTEDLFQTLKTACLSRDQKAPEQADTPQWIGLQL
jgi:pyruvate ferredoxin oxidoreductase alpha subunit